MWHQCHGLSINNAPIEPNHLLEQISYSDKLEQVAVN